MYVLNSEHFLFLRVFQSNLHLHTSSFLDNWITRPLVQALTYTYLIETSERFLEGGKLVEKRKDLSLPIYSLNDSVRCK